MKGEKLKKLAEFAYYLHTSGEPVNEHLEGTLSTCSYNIKEDIFLTNGLYNLACCIV